MNKISFEVKARVSTKVDTSNPIVVYDTKVWEEGSGGRICLFSQTYLLRTDAILAGRREAVKYKKAKELEATLDRPYVEEV